MGVLDAAQDFADGIERASKRQFDDEPGGGVFDPDTYLPGADAPGSDAEVPDEEGIATAPEDVRGDGPLVTYLGAIPRQFDDDPGGGFLDEARDIGPDYLDEVTIVAVVVVVVGGILWLARPLLMIVAEEVGS